MGQEDVKGSDAVTPSLAGDPPALVPARMVNEVLYCERLVYLEWAQGEFDDNVFTIDGRAVHRRADQPGGELPKSGAARPRGMREARGRTSVLMKRGAFGSRPRRSG